jgi:hypothetical protein
VEWLHGHGEVDRVGVEGTGAYGAALARQLREAGMLIVEVDRPDRRARRAHGKSDPLDAIRLPGLRCHAVLGARMWWLATARESAAAESRCMDTIPSELGASIGAPRTDGDRRARDDLGLALRALVVVVQCEP